MDCDRRDAEGKPGILVGKGTHNCPHCRAILHGPKFHACDYLAFDEALDGVPLDEAERKWLRWLAGMDSRERFLGIVYKLRASLGGRYGV